MKKDTQQLIDRFWAGTATDAEKQQLADALDAPGSDWQQQLSHAFDQQSQTTGPLTEEQSARVLMRVHRQVLNEAEAKPTFTIWRQWVRWSAAAVFALVAGLGVWLGTRPDEPALVRPGLASSWQLTHKTNSTQSPARITLADGSMLTLQPGSSVSYYEPFGKSSRNISMNGTVFFAVAKDPAHPFTVLASGITTTALGTQFSVQTTTADQVSVRLFEGRVVVRATATSGFTIPDTYLKPGERIQIDTRSARVQVSPVERAVAKPVGPQQPAVALARPVAPGLVFAKEPLEQVLTQVEQRYNVKIEYVPADVQGLSFSGSFAADDSLRTVLSAVCMTNNLSFTQEAGRVIITRSP